MKCMVGAHLHLCSSKALLAIEMYSTVKHAHLAYFYQ